MSEIYNDYIIEHKKDLEGNIIEYCILNPEFCSSLRRDVEVEIERRISQKVKENKEIVNDNLKAFLQEKEKEGYKFDNEDNIIQTPQDLKEQSTSQGYK